MVDIKAIIKEVKEHSLNIGTKTLGVPIPLSSLFNVAGERTFPKHRDENKAVKFLNICLCVGM